jgi:hemoglobin
MTENRLTQRPMGRRGFLKTTGGIAVFGGAFMLVGCGDDDDDSTPTQAPTNAASGTTESLYSRLGGGMAVKAVVDDFLVNVGGDARINTFFANTNLPRLNMLLVEQIGAATGGPEKYTGRDMKTTHAGMKVTMADFNALVEDLVKSLDKFKVPEKEKNELLGILGPLNKDIVTA